MAYMDLSLFPVLQIIWTYPLFFPLSFKTVADPFSPFLLPYMDLSPFPLLLMAQIT